MKGMHKILGRIQVLLEAQKDSENSRKTGNFQQTPPVGFSTPKSTV